MKKTHYTPPGILFHAPVKPIKKTYSKWLMVEFFSSLSFPAPDFRDLTFNSTLFMGPDFVPFLQRIYFCHAYTKTEDVSHGESN